MSATRVPQSLDRVVTREIAGETPLVPKSLDRVVTREIAGETLLVPISDDITDMHHIFALNPVAAHIWNALDGKTPVNELVESLCAAFEVEPERAGQDLAVFLDELLESGLVREA